MTENDEPSVTGRLRRLRQARKAQAERVRQYIVDTPSCSLTDIAVHCLGGTGEVRRSTTSYARSIVSDLEARGVVRRVPAVGGGLYGRPFRYFGVDPTMDNPRETGEVLPGDVDPTALIDTSEEALRGLVLRHAATNHELRAAAQAELVDWRLGDRAEEQIKPTHVGTRFLATLRTLAACAHCGARPICIGIYEHSDNPLASACDDCCAHGNEDGWCDEIYPAPGPDGRAHHVLRAALVFRDKHPSYDGMTPHEDDHEYSMWLAECARTCRCCASCKECPCAGVTAGGVCDALPCDCDDELVPPYIGSDQETP